ncbi:hypothetical protein BCV70DRAFT_9115 [Testicularia cyperi]|uniref:Uncharacterized protein n=1 Tax=Testicularia cyperi TaxID=1882483 RepID=A0A317XXY1_9BASI|nr:hypothetical protein BCV70DRAFT_9115 [Testicularia cyperi]
MQGKGQRRRIRRIELDTRYSSRAVVLLFSSFTVDNLPSPRPSSSLRMHDCTLSGFAFSVETCGAWRGGCTQQTVYALAMLRLVLFAHTAASPTRARVQYSQGLPALHCTVLYSTAIQKTDLSKQGPTWLAKVPRQTRLRVVSEIDRQEPALP